jgi:hypothetical protein
VWFFVLFLVGERERERKRERKGKRVNFVSKSNFLVFSISFFPSKRRESGKKKYSKDGRSKKKLCFLAITS